MFTLDAPVGRINSLAFSSDGRRLAAASRTGGVFVWDLATRKLTHTRTAHLFLWIVWAPGRNLLAMGNMAHCSLWDLDRNEVRTLQGSQGIGTNLAYHINPRLLTVAYAVPWRGNPDLELRTWHLPTRELVNHHVRNAVRPVHAVAIPCEESGSLAVSHDAHVTLFEDARRSVFTRLPGKRPIHALQFCPGGQTLALLSTLAVDFFDVPTRGVRATLRANGRQINDIAFSPDSRTLVGAIHDGSVRLWDVATGREKAVFHWDDRAARVVAFSPDGMTAAVGGDRPQIVVWDLDVPGS